MYKGYYDSDSLQVSSYPYFGLGYSGLAGSNPVATEETQELRSVAQIKFLSVR